MKNIKILILGLSICSGYAFGQVGIGTTAPASSAALDITSTNRGVLIPRVGLIDFPDPNPLTNIGTLQDGTLVFNTVTIDDIDSNEFLMPGVYIWKDNKWSTVAKMGVPERKVAKFTSPAGSTTNFNPTTATPVTVDIFGAEVFNDSAGTFEKLSDTQLRINETGLYQVSVNLALRQNPQVVDSSVCNYIYLNLDTNLASSRVPTLVPQYDPNDIGINGRFAFGLNTYIKR
jgi:hypothetical protein